MRPHGRQSYMQWLSYTTVEGFSHSSRNTYQRLDHN